MKVRAVGWIASHMQRKLITIVLALCISVLVFICLVPLEKEFVIKNYHYQENHHAYPHAPNRPIFGRPGENMTYDITGRQFIAPPADRDRVNDPTECEEDPAERRRRKLLPNVIGLGVKKCGTTALHYYMSAHPKVKVPPDHEELGFFDRRWDNGLDWYLERLPNVADDEITFEKTPKYFVFPPALDRIAETIPQVKFILLICNPIDRAYSDFNHKLRKSPKFRKALAAKGVDSFDNYVQKFSPKLRKMKPNQIEELLENDQYNAVPGSDDDAKHWLTPLTVGFYSHYLDKFLSRFSRNQFLVLSGDELRLDPFRVMTKVQMFMDLPLCLKENNFHFNDTKGFYCLSRNGTDFCLDDSKGTSRKPSNAKKYSIETAEELFNLYSPYTRKLRDLGVNISWPFPEETDFVN